MGAVVWKACVQGIVDTRKVCSTPGPKYYGLIHLSILAVLSRVYYLVQVYDTISKTQILMIVKLVLNTRT